MEALLSFLVNTSLGIILFYIIYWLLLSKETHYNANRYFLLSALLISVILPLFPYHYTVFIESGNESNVFTSVNNAINSINPQVIEGAEETVGLQWLNTTIIIYLTGVFIFLLRLLIQTIILISLIIKHEIKSINGIRIIENRKYGLPFSFFNIIFINKKFHKQDDLPEIMAHEKVHIRENHWVDLIIIELLTVILWFNPFIWFFERSIKQNHEYLADRGVLQKGTHIGKYQALLVNQLMGMQIIGLTNNLNFALNTNRLKMMKKQKTPKKRMIKLAWSIPAIAMLLFAFSEPVFRVKSTNNNGQENNIEEISISEEIKIIGYVMDENGKSITGASILVKGKTKGTVSDEKGEFTLSISESDNIVISFVGKKTLVKGATEIISQKNENGIYYAKFEMKEGLVTLDLNKLLKESPPAPPKANATPEMPSPLKKDQKEEIFYVVETMPEYPGGKKALAEHIIRMQKNLKSKIEIAGKAVIGFTIESDGNISDIKILKKDNEKVGNAASSIIKSLKKWKPGTQRGKAVPVNYVIPIEF